MVKARKMRGSMVAAAGGAMLLLSGCGGSGGPLADALAPCPNISILADAADLTRFRPGAGEDLTAMVLTASLSSFQAKCDYARRGSGLEVTLTPGFLAERGPAATGRTADMQYMVAVVEGDRILSRGVYGLRVEFPPNVTRSVGRGEEISIQLGGTPAEAARRRVLLGFVLSPEELTANRLRGPR